MRIASRQPLPLHAATAPAPTVESGRLHEVLGEGEADGVGVTLGWIGGGGEGEGGASCHVWIGRRVWPGADGLGRAGARAGALLVAADSAGRRAWAAELCVRCPAVRAVVVDGRGMDLTMTRRLQLAVRGRDCRLVMLRPNGAGGVGGGGGGGSAAGSRWSVRPARVGADPATGDPPRRPRWQVRLLRRKGGHLTLETTNRGFNSGPRPAADRPAGLRTAGEMFGDDPTTTDDAHDDHGHARGWTYEWDPDLGRGVPVGVPVDVPLGPPADVAGRPAAAAGAAAG